MSIPFPVRASLNLLKGGFKENGLAELQRSIELYILSDGRIYIFVFSLRFHYNK